MSYQSDMLAHIEADAAIVALVGTGIYADVADGTAAAPFIVYSVVSTGGETVHDGTRNLEFPLLQFSCYATTKAGAIDLAVKLRRRLEGKRIPGVSDAVLVFSDQHGTRDADTNLFVEIIDLRGACNTND